MLQQHFRCCRNAINQLIRRKLAEAFVGTDNQGPKIYAQIAFACFDTYARSLYSQNHVTALQRRKARRVSNKSCVINNSWLSQCVAPATNLALSWMINNMLSKTLQIVEVVSKPSNQLNLGQVNNLDRKAEINIY